MVSALVSAVAVRAGAILVTTLATAVLELLVLSLPAQIELTWLLPCWLGVIVVLAVGTL